MTHVQEQPVAQEAAPARKPNATELCGTVVANENFKSLVEFVQGGYNRYTKNIGITVRSEQVEDNQVPAMLFGQKDYSFYSSENEPATLRYFKAEAGMTLIVELGSQWLRLVLSPATGLWRRVGEQGFAHRIGA